MSKRRILPALVLAGCIGFLGAHRFYAGRWITGLIQLVLFAAGSWLLSRELAAIQFSTLAHLQTVDQMLEWATENQDQISVMPTLLVAAPVFWALIDCIQLAARKFKDGSGMVMTRWV